MVEPITGAPIHESAGRGTSSRERSWRFLLRYGKYEPTGEFESLRELGRNAWSRIYDNLWKLR